MLARGAWVVGIAAVLASLAACHVSAKAKASTSEGASGDLSASGDSNENAFSDSPTPAETAASAAPVPTLTQAAARPACPIDCFVASGAARLELTADEQGKASSALATVFDRMHACADPGEWKKRGSPLLIVRFAADGSLTDIGVDPRRDPHGCAQSAVSTTNVSLSLPGRAAIRCSERCAKRR